MIQNKPHKVELWMFLIALFITGVGLYYLGPSITGFVIKEFSYEDTSNLVITSSGNYTWQLQNAGDLKYVKLDGRVTKSGKARVYIENNGVRYLVFDSSRLSENDNTSTSNGTISITGFAVGEDENKSKDNNDENETQNDEDKKKKNKKPEWNGNGGFAINGTTTINLSQYFTDKDGDALIYAASQAEGLAVSINNELVTITPTFDNDFNTTITFTASDGIDSKSQTVDLAVYVIKPEPIMQPNRAPVWNSGIDAFIINGTTTINLSQYFTDEDNDTLTFSVSDAIDISESISGSILNLSTEKDNLNATLTITANDGNLSANKDVKLIVPLIPITINETNETIAKIITINLSYNSGTIYDANDNGEESVNGVVDLNVENTGFNWDVDKSKLCTRWEVYNIEEEKLTTFCNGNNDCCAFVGLLPTNGNWSGIYYSAFGKDNAGHDNIVSAQVLYYDVNLSLDNIKSEIYNSEWANLSVKFFEEEKEFFNACLETCSLTGLNKSSYTLIFEIEDDAVLRIDKIKYSVSADVINKPPLLLQNFLTINVSKNKNTTINLSQYFADPDGDILAYSYYKTDNITILFENTTAVILPDKGVDGIRYTYITANDSENIAVSNAFIINVSEEKFKPRVVVGKPVKWQSKILIDASNVSSVNLSLPESASNISIRILNETAENALSDEKIKVIEDGRVKDKDVFEVEKKLENIKKKISILEEAKQKGASKVAIDDKDFDINEFDLKLNELNNKKVELENQLNKLSSINSNLITGNVVGLTGFVTALTETTINETQPILMINESLAQNIEITVEYETPAPIAIEDEINAYTKQIKIVSDTSYEDVLSYTALNDVPQNAIKLYWIKDNAKELFNDVSYIDENQNGLIDRIEWVIPHLSNQTFEVSITILNVQSYPTVGGNWTVAFNTTGTGNLTIYGYNGTSYAEKEIDDSATSNDLDILELKCDVNVLEPLFIVELGNSSLEGFTTISGDVVGEIEKRKDDAHLSFGGVFGNILKSKDESVNNLPLNSDALTLSNKLINDENTDLISGGCILINTIPLYSSGGNSKILPKCLSKDNITLPSELDKSANSLSPAPRGAFFTSNPSFNNNSTNLFGIFSSESSLGLEDDIPFLFNQLGGILSRGQNSFSGELGKVVFENFLWGNASSQQFQNLPDHYSGAFESGLPMADFRIGYNKFVDLNGSHRTNNENDIFKSIANPATEKFNNEKSTLNFKNNQNPITEKPNNENSIKNFKNNQNLIIDLENINKKEENRKSLNHVETVQPEIYHNTNRYLNVFDATNFNVVERARSLTDKTPVRLTGRCEFENWSEISPRSHLYNKKEENQAHSLNKTTGRLTGISHKFNLISENYRNTHTVDIDYTNEYLNVSVLDNDNQNSITEKFINEETKIKDNNYLKDFFTIIPSVYALHVGNGTYTTINIEGKQYALLTKEQLQGHSYKIIGAYYENYNCDNLTGYWTVKVLTSGIHNQRFNFSGQIADAHNLASAANVTTNGSVYQFIDDVQADFTAGVNNLTNSTASPGNVILANTSATSNNYVSKGNFTSRVFDANASVNWTALAFSTDVPYQRDLEDLKNASTVLLMHFNNDTGESERQLNETHTISNEGNLVLYMPFDSANARELVPNGSTVLLMHFNNDTGTGENASLFLNNATNSSGGMANGTCNLASGFCPVYNSSNAKLGNAGLEFDGSDDTINTTIRNIQANSNGFTVELWAKHTSTGFKFLAGDRDASTSNGEWSFAINNAGSDLSFNTWFGAGPSNDNLQSSSAGINDKNWHHLAATFDAGTGVKRIYVDGAQIATSTTVSGTPGTAGTEVTIGRVTEFPTSFIFAGTLDEVAIYNISLSSEIIAKHSGYGIDKSIYGNNASLMYNVTINQTGCKFGECLVFNNNAFRFVNITDSSSLDVKNMTLSAWIYRKSTGTRDMIVTKTNDGTDGWQLEVDNVDKLSYSNANSPCDTAALLQGSTIISANQWYHVAATIGSDDTNRVYVNGVLDGSASDTTGVCVNNLVVLIGRRIAAGDEQPFDGIIDELSIWNQSLPSDKIAQHAGTKILDYSQYANNGTRSFNSTSDFGRNFTDGKFSKALVFDGVNDFVTVGNKSTYNFLHGALDTANFKFTIETWMKLPNPNTNALYSLISSGPAGSGATGTTFYYEDRDAVRKRSLSLWIVSTGGTICDNTACISNANSYPSDSGWHHVAAVYDSTPASNNANFYIDGVFAGQGSKTANGATGDSTYPLHIGSTGIESFFFPGSLDEVAIWNMTLENDTIKQHALRGFGNLSLQARTCTQSDCSDNPSFGTTYFTNASNIYNLNLSNSRYFQYIAYLSTNSTNLTPVLNNVSINYSLRSNLTIWDDTDTLVRVVTQNVRFYANFTNGVNSINGTNINCSFSHNLSGSFSQETNMSFNSTTGIYFIDQQFSINKTAFFNVTCDATILGYNKVKLLDDFTIYPSLNITLNLNVSTVLNTGVPVAVSGHINLSNGSNVSNNQMFIFVNGNDANITSGFTGNGINFTDTSQGDFTAGINNLTNATASPGNVTLANDTSSSVTKYFSRGNFTSRIFNASTFANWTNISFATDVPYQTEIGRATGDAANAVSPFINTSGLVLLMHFNNESSLGEATETTSAGDNYSVDFSVDVNSERAGSARNNGTFYGGATINKTNYKFGGGAGQFDGVDDRISANSSSLAITGDITIEAWVKPTDFSVVRSIANRGTTNVANTYLFDITTNGVLRYVAGETTAISGTSALTAGSWSHVVVTFNPTSDAFKFYINGIVDTDTSYTQTPSSSPCSTLIGAREDSGTGCGSSIIENFLGTIDEVAIWNTTLSADVIKQHALRGFGNLSLQARTCTQSDCSDAPAFQGSNGTGTYFTNTSAQNNVGLTGRYFQYIAYLSTNSTNLTPMLQEVNVSYKGIFTDAFGNYNYTLTAPTSAGTSTIKVNTTYANIPGEQTATLSVRNAQTISLAAGGAFIVQSPTGASLAIFDSNGNVNILGNLSQNSELYAGPKDFAVQNSTGGLNLVITNPEGNMSIKNLLAQNQASPLSPTPSSFVIQNSTGRTVAYVNSTGGLFLTGTLVEKVLFG